MHNIGIYTFAALLFTAMQVSFAGTVEDSCANKKPEEQCACYAEQAKIYEEKLRSGYTAKEYNTLEGKRRYFKDKAYACKEK